jgi:hypothetical protein
MTKTNGIGSLFVILALALDISVVWAQFNQDQTQIIKDTAASICNTVDELRGKETDINIQGDVTAKLQGILGKIANVGAGGAGSLSQSEFEGLTRDATAAALTQDQGCRERVFNKMFDKLTPAPHAAPKASWKLCFGDGEGIHCREGADIYYDCNKYKSWNQAAWDNLANDLCGSKDKMTKIEIQNNHGGGCGWTGYTLKCNQ